MTPVGNAHRGFVLQKTPLCKGRFFLFLELQIGDVTSGAVRSIGKIPPDPTRSECFLRLFDFGNKILEKIFSFSVFGLAKRRKIGYNIVKWQEML